MLQAAPCEETGKKFAETITSEYVKVSQGRPDPVTFVLEVTTYDGTRGLGLALSLGPINPEENLISEAKVNEQGTCEMEGQRFNYIIYSFDRAVQVERKPSGNEGSGS
jgi:hypothetical protein